MRRLKSAVDPVWQCLCPIWASTSGQIVPKRRLSNLAPPQQCLNIRPKQSSVRARVQIPAITPRRSLTTSAPHSAIGKPYGTDDSLIRTGKHKVLDRGPSSLYLHLEQAAADHDLEYCKTLVNELVRGRGEKPNYALYNALILANAHPLGLAWRAHKILEEMEEQELEPDLATCHNVLAVLAVHPDGLLRADILRYMQSKWLELSPRGHHDVAVGCLREGCFEMALDALEKMRNDGIHVETWLLDMFAYMLADAGEMDAVYQIMRPRYEACELNISTVLWHWLLDLASAARHQPLTELVWRTQVQSNLLQVNSGTCLNVMSTASRVGDPSLATDVFKYLAQRGEKITELHYQLLIDSYLASATPDIERALGVLCVMYMDKLQPTGWQTRSLYAHMQQNPQMTREAFRILREFHEEGRPVPIAAFNLIIECCTAQYDLEEASKVYKQIHILGQPGKPFADKGTFDMLLRACRYAVPADTQLAEFYMSEMRALRVQPDALTYDRLLLVYVWAAKHASERAADPHSDQQQEVQLAAKNLELAMNCFREIATLGLEPRANTVEALAIELAGRNDARCWDLLQYTEDHASSTNNWELKSSITRQKLEYHWQNAVFASEMSNPVSSPAPNPAFAAA